MKYFLIFILSLSIASNVFSSEFEDTLTLANQGDAEAQFNLGRMYDNGHVTERNILKAIKWYKKAAEQDSAGAQHNLGVIYAFGQGVPVNHNEAFRWFTKSANQGVADSQYNLGACYFYGQGTKENKSKAFNWFLKGANNGDNLSKHMLGLMYETGDGVKQNTSKAIKWYLNAADSGLLDSQFNLALMYETGRDVKKNLLKAYFWFSKAAQRGDIEAKNHIEKLEKKLSDNELEDAKAMLSKDKQVNDRFRFNSALRLAKNGNVDSQFEVGLFYNLGIGVPKDLGSAYAWYLIADHNNDLAAKNSIEFLEKEMTKKEWARGQLKAAICIRSELKDCD
jgi:TPR repeat protein